MLLEGRRGESRMFRQREDSKQMKVCWIRPILQQQQTPAECGLGWSHPSGRKNSTGMVTSILRQFGELLDKTAGVVPATLSWWIREYVGWVLTFEMPIAFK